MRVLHITTPADFGGLERVVEMLSKGLLARGHEVTNLAVVDATSESHPFIARLSEQGIPFVQVKAASRAYLLERRAVRDAVARLRPDVVHSHGYRADVVDSGVARSAGVATVSTVHGFIGGGWRNNVYEWLQVRAFRRFSCAVAVSRPIADRLLAAGVPAETVRLVPNSHQFDTPLATRDESLRRLGLDGDGFNVGWIGRLSIEKGPDVMLEAAILLAGCGVSVSFVGTGPMLEALRSRAAGSGYEHLIRFHGSVPNAGHFMTGFNVIALSSRTEGTPIVLLEGVAAEVPIVCTGVGGIPDIVSSSEAIMVEKESVEQIVAAVLRLRSDPALARRLALAAKARMTRELGFAAWLDSYEDVYATAIQARRH